MTRYLFPIYLTLATCAAQAQTADLSLCRSLPDAAQRLACYDSIPLPQISAENRGNAAPNEPLRPTTAAPAPQAAEAAKPGDFGLENQPRAGRVEEIVSRIPGPFEGWDPKTRFRLENGQLWKVVDGSRASYSLQNPVAHIRRALLGSFLMEIDGVAQLIRVRRVE
ncbi:hypothetical protein [Rubrivivax gelatinosus]|uniref:hypothetical protein n=1 Tax=Rubrivivax gelatinosus TaxID=28068 RepID=UPI00190749D2|nr:hypothetical protein [Rubrivivax gelatinosus]